MFNHISVGMRWMPILWYGAFFLVLSRSGPLAQAAPAWWVEREVLSGQSADDYAVANVGQLKFIAAKAADEMNLKLTGGAGSSINGMITEWRDEPDVSSPPRDDYAVLNQGQLKYVAVLFYSRLAEFNYSGPPLSGGAIYPWSDEPEDDDAYAAVNLGQLKYVFSFVPALVSVPPLSDSDVDGLPDVWELQYWSDLSHGGGDDPDSDGVENLTEYRQGRNPTKGAVSDSSGAVGLRVYSPAP